MAAEAGAWRGRPSTAEIVLGVVATALAIALVLVFALRSNDTSDVRTVAGRAAVAAADDQVLALTTLDHRTVEAQVADLRSTAAESYRDRLDQQLDRFVETVRAGKIRATGELVSSALVSLSDERAEVLVVTDALVTTASDRTGQPRRYRFRVELVRDESEWLVADMKALS